MGFRPCPVESTEGAPCAFPATGMPTNKEKSRIGPTSHFMHRRGNEIAIVIVLLESVAIINAALGVAKLICVPSREASGIKPVPTPQFDLFYVPLSGTKGVSGEAIARLCAFMCFFRSHPRNTPILRPGS